jgi:hypothetical protein
MAYPWSSLEQPGGCSRGKGAVAVNSIWLKIAGVAVVVVVVIVVLGRLGGDKPASAPPEEEKTFYDMAERDKQFQEEPKPAGEPAPGQTQQPAAQSQAPTEQPSAPQPTAQVPGVVLPSSITQPTTLYFKPLDEIDDIAAQELLPWAVAGRSIGRLPMVQYGLMVKACRQILEEITQYTKNYKITPQELDISRFMKPRRGSEPRTVEPVR